METRPPTVTRILIAVGFAISCFGLALFLWLAFGGAIPLKPESYRFTVPFDEATQLAVESDVRISGVSVGKVKQVDLADGGYAEATIELQAQYGPIPENTRAMLRQKTLLGETYVELTPGDADGETLPEGDSLAPAQVSEAVQLDEIFRTFDPRTRAAFQAWMQGAAASLRNRGDDLSLTIASLEPFADEAERALRVLDSQERAVSEFFDQSGEVFAALSERQGQLRGLIENSNIVFETTANRNEEFAEAFRIFPTFLRESRATLSRLEQFAIDTDPVVVALRPTAAELTPTARELGDLAPQLESFFVALRGTIAAAPDGFEATRNLLDDRLPPLLGRFDPWLAQLNSVLEVIRMYRREVTSLLGNVAAASNGAFFDLSAAENVNYVRSMAPLSPEALAAYPRRLEITRTNPYAQPGGVANVANGLESFETRQCGSGVGAFLDPTTPTDPDFQERVDGNATEAQLFFDRLRGFAFAGQLSTDTMGQPPCTDQPPFDSVGAPAETTEYQHVYPLP